MLTGVIDIGKTRSRLILLDSGGNVVDQRSTDSRVCSAAAGWRALDSEATWDWLVSQLASLGAERKRVRRLITATHGAAVAALSGEELALPVPDYEFEDFDERPDETLLALDPFGESLSPVLPRGLNMGLQLDWLARHEAAAFGRVDRLLPYAQYWSWRLSGVAASEVSSLGCHTLLWKPRKRTWSDWAVNRGWAAKFAPMRAAWEALGAIDADLARQTGIAGDTIVHVGAHDSNACLARWLRHWPRMTLVSTGTWVVVMAPGSTSRGLDPQADELANVSVRGELVPTARFMGGRELTEICAGADPALASLEVLDLVLARGLQLLPAFETQGGPFRHRTGVAVDLVGPVSLADLNPAVRATAAALYVAQMAVYTIERLGGAQPVVLEGPFASNPVIVAVMAALLPPNALHTVDDELEGTVRGCAMLSSWIEFQRHAPTTRRTPPSGMVRRLRAHHSEWLASVDRSAA